MPGVGYVFDKDNTDAWGTWYRGDKDSIGTFVRVNYSTVSKKSTQISLALESLEDMTRMCYEHEPVDKDMLQTLVHVTSVCQTVYV